MSKKFKSVIIGGQTIQAADEGTKTRELSARELIHEGRQADPDTLAYQLSISLEVALQALSACIEQIEDYSDNEYIITYDSTGALKADYKISNIKRFLS